MANSVPAHLPVHIVQCIENWWVRGDTLLAMPAQSLKSMNGLLIYIQNLQPCVFWDVTPLAGTLCCVTRLHGVTRQKSVVFIVSATSTVECLLRKCIRKCWVTLAAQKCTFYV